LRALAKRHGINPKTLAKWRKRSSAADMPNGPKDAKSSVLSTAEEAIIVAFRKHTLLPLDDCLSSHQADGGVRLIGLLDDGQLLRGRPVTAALRSVKNLNLGGRTSHRWGCLIAAP
jgi:hypothetical protein